ncbi:MAG: hypothetical protein V1837_03915 [Candidatus Woesearchaeota archaeon]
MAPKISRRDFLKNIVKAAVVVPPSYVIGTSVAHAASKKPLFEGTIEGKLVSYYTGTTGWISNDPDRMEIRSNDLHEIIEDYDRNENIGDHPDDKLTVNNCNGKFTYTKNFMIDNQGNKYADEGMIGSKVMCEARRKLCDANNEYRHLKCVIAQIIADRVR